MRFPKDVYEVEGQDYRRDLTTLEDQSKVPKRRREWTVTPKEKVNVIALRKKHLKWGKEKLKREYLKVYGQVISTNKIQKVINKHNLYPEPEEHKRRIKRASKRRSKTYIHQFEKQKKLGFLWHTDAVILWWYASEKSHLYSLRGADQDRLCSGLHDQLFQESHRLSQEAFVPVR